MFRVGPMLFPNMEQGSPSLLVRIDQPLHKVTPFLEELELLLHKGLFGYSKYQLIRGVFRKYVDKAKIVQICLDTYLYLILPYAEFQS